MEWRVKAEGVLVGAICSRNLMHRVRAKRDNLKRCSGLLPESQGQNLALIGLYVPGLLGSGTESPHCKATPGSLCKAHWPWSHCFKMALGAIFCSAAVCWSLPNARRAQSGHFVLVCSSISHVLWYVVRCVLGIFSECSVRGWGATGRRERKRDRGERERERARERERGRE